MKATLEIIKLASDVITTSNQSCANELPPEEDA